MSEEMDKCLKCCNKVSKETRDKFLKQQEGEIESKNPENRPPKCPICLTQQPLKEKFFNESIFFGGDNQ
jgi:hypothetical protein